VNSGLAIMKRDFHDKVNLDLRAQGYLIDVNVVTSTFYLRVNKKNKKKGKNKNK
jgi:hypothetical protein